MKKTILSFLFLASILSSANAQINLVHTFNTATINSVPYGLTDGFGSFQSKTNGLMFYVYNTSDGSSISIYKSDYTLYKTVSLTLPAGYESVSVSGLFSEDIFNSDSKIEFTCVYFHSTGMYQGDAMLGIVNEDGTVLKTVAAHSVSCNGNCLIPSIIENTNGNLLVVQIPASQPLVEIYSLPTSKTAILKNASLDQKSAYPNPATTIVNLPYNLRSGETATLSVYNQGGVLMQQMEISGNMSSVSLDVSSFAAGLYVYKYNNMSGRFLVD
jgi:hypothetical protein